MTRQVTTTPLRVWLMSTTGDVLVTCVTCPPSLPPAGSALTEHEMMDLHYDRMVYLQRTCFQLYPELRGFALSNVASVDQRKSLMKHFSPLR